MATQKHLWILGGGLASGKSRVRELLVEAGVAAIDADRVGHAVLEPDGPAFMQVARRWSEAVVDGRIDRKALAAIVFADPDELTELERFTHPHIFGMIESEVEEIDGPVVVEMPVITNRLGAEWRRMVVDSHDDVRMRRAVERGMEEADARARLSSQPKREEWLAAADLVIPNHGSMSELEECVSHLVGWL